MKISSYIKYTAGTLLEIISFTPSSSDRRDYEQIPLPLASFTLVLLTGLIVVLALAGLTYFNVI